MRAQHSALLRPEHKGMPDLSDGAIDKKLRQAAPQRRLGMLSTRGMVGTCVWRAWHRIRARGVGMEDGSVDLARVDRCEVEGEGGKGVSTMIRIDAKTDTY